jgi:hypothetical protein
MGVRSGILGDCFLSFSTSRSLTVDTNGLIDFNDRAALIIDSQFLVQSSESC